MRLEGYRSRRASAGEDPKQAASDIRERVVAYALRAIKLCRVLERSRSTAAQVIAKQYLRAATSIGANVTEARSAESRADFIHRYSIAQKEGRESLYWLTLLEESGIVSPRKIGALRQETDEILAIITRIIIRAKAKTC